jgi:hypothetical protein
MKAVAPEADHHHPVQVQAHLVEAAEKVVAASDRADLVGYPCSNLPSFCLRNLP